MQISKIVNENLKNEWESKKFNKIEEEREIIKKFGFGLDQINQALAYYLQHEPKICTYGAGAGTWNKQTLARDIAALSPYYDFIVFSYPVYTVYTSNDSFKKDLHQIAIIIDTHKKNITAINSRDFPLIDLDDNTFSNIMNELNLSRIITEQFQTKSNFFTDHKIDIYNTKLQKNDSLCGLHVFINILSTLKKIPLEIGENFNTETWMNELLKLVEEGAEWNAQTQLQHSKAFIFLKILIDKKIIFGSKFTEFIEKYSKLPLYSLQNARQFWKSDKNRIEWTILNDGENISALACLSEEEFTQAAELVLTRKDNHATKDDKDSLFYVISNIELDLKQKDSWLEKRSYLEQAIHYYLKNKLWPEEISKSINESSNYYKNMNLSILNRSLFSCIASILANLKNSEVVENKNKVGPDTHYDYFKKIKETSVKKYLVTIEDSLLYSNLTITEIRKAKRDLKLLFSVGSEIFLLKPQEWHILLKENIVNDKFLKFLQDLKEHDNEGIWLDIISYVTKVCTQYKITSILKNMIVLPELAVTFKFVGKLFSLLSKRDYIWLLRDWLLRQYKIEGKDAVNLISYFPKEKKLEFSKIISLFDTLNVNYAIVVRALSTSEDDQFEFLKFIRNKVKHGSVIAEIANELPSVKRFQWTIEIFNEIIQSSDTDFLHIFSVFEKPEERKEFLSKYQNKINNFTDLDSKISYMICLYKLYNLECFKKEKILEFIAFFKDKVTSLSDLKNLLKHVKDIAISECPKIAQYHLELYKLYSWADIVSITSYFSAEDCAIEIKKYIHLIKNYSDVGYINFLPNEQYFNLCLEILEHNPNLFLEALEKKVLYFSAYELKNIQDKIKEKKKQMNSYVQGSENFFQPSIPANQQPIDLKNVTYEYQNTYERK